MAQKDWKRGIMSSEFSDDQDLSDKQSLAAHRTTRIKSEKLKLEIQLYIRYKRRNGMKPTIKGTSRVLQCSKNSVKKYWLSEREYPVHEPPEKGWKYNRHGVIEPISDIGPLDDDSDFFEIRERRLPSFLEETDEVRKPIKKKKKPKQNPEENDDKLDVETEMPDFLQPDYPKCSLRCKTQRNIVLLSVIY